MMFQIHHLPPTKGIERSGIFLILFAKLPAFGRETPALPGFDVAFVPNLREKEWLDTKHPHTHRIYGRYTYIYHKNHPNVTAIYTIVPWICPSCKTEIPLPKPISFKFLGQKSWPTFTQKGATGGKGLLIRCTKVSSSKIQGSISN